MALVTGDVRIRENILEFFCGRCTERRHAIAGLPGADGQGRRHEFRSKCHHLRSGGVCFCGDGVRSRDSRLQFTAQLRQGEGRAGLPGPASGRRWRRCVLADAHEAHVVAGQPERKVVIDADGERHASEVLESTVQAGQRAMRDGHFCGQQALQQPHPQRVGERLPIRWRDRLSSVGRCFQAIGILAQSPQALLQAGVSVENAPEQGQQLIAHRVAAEDVFSIGRVQPPVADAVLKQVGFNLLAADSEQGPVQLDAGDAPVRPQPGQTRAVGAASHFQEEVFEGVVTMMAQEDRDVSAAEFLPGFQALAAGGFFDAFARLTMGRHFEMEQLEADASLLAELSAPFGIVISVLATQAMMAVDSQDAGSGGVQAEEQGSAVSAAAESADDVLRDVVGGQEFRDYIGQ